MLGNKFTQHTLHPKWCLFLRSCIFRRLLHHPFASWLPRLYLYCCGSSWTLNEAALMCAGWLGWSVAVSTGIGHCTWVQVLVACVAGTVCPDVACVARTVSGCGMCGRDWVSSCGMCDGDRVSKFGLCGRDCASRYGSCCRNCVHVACVARTMGPCVACCGSIWCGLRGRDYVSSCGL